MLKCRCHRMNCDKGSGAWSKYPCPSYHSWPTCTAKDNPRGRSSLANIFFFWRRWRFHMKESRTTLIFICIYVYIYMAAAQNVRSGASPGPTHDPDLRSRPFERIWSRPLIQTFGMIWFIGEFMSGPVMVACFWVSCSAVIHPAKQPSNKLL